MRVRLRRYLLRPLCAGVLAAASGGNALEMRPGDAAPPEALWHHYSVPVRKINMRIFGAR